MSALTTALRKCHETLKLIDHADCKNDAVWNAVIDAQAEAERALRDGEKQEPVAYRTTFNDFRHFSGATASGRDYVQFDKPVHDSRFFEGCDSLVITPLYDHPAPSLPAVVAVPEAVLARTEEIRQAMGNPTGVGRHTLIGYTECLLAHIAFTNSPQPAAAPSGDVERDAERYCTLFSDNQFNRLAVVKFAEFDDPIVFTKKQADEHLDAAITATKE